jgi:hypothetical protein
VCGIGALALAASCEGSGVVEIQLASTTAPPDGVVSAVLSLERVDVHAKPKKVKVKGKKAKKEKGEKKAKKDKSQKGGWMTLDGAPAEIDLVALQNDVRATLGSLSLPEGKVTQIRLIPDRDGKNEVRLGDGTVCAIDLSQVGPKGIKINHPFKAIDVKAGKMREVVVEIDLEKSLERAEGEGCTFKLAPKIKLRPQPDDDEDDDGP